MTTSDNAKKGYKYSVILNCKVCGKEFDTYPALAEKRKYCSYKCSSIGREPTRYWKGRKLTAEHRRKISENHANVSGENAPAWKGGKRKHTEGYILLYSPSHPNKDNKLEVLEHRLVMEQHLGRYLTKKEVVHHINEIRTDNRIENLMLFPDNAKHLLFHRESYTRKTNPKNMEFTYDQNDTDKKD